MKALIEDKQLLAGLAVLVISGALSLLGQVINFPFDTSWANDGVLLLNEAFAFFGGILMTLSDRIKNPAFRLFGYDRTVSVKARASRSKR